MWVTGTQGIIPTAATPQASTAYNPGTNQLASPAAYDPAGNQTFDLAGNHCLYDGENRLVDFANGTGAYTYDGDGHRVTKTASAGTSVFVYDIAGRLIAEYGGPTSTSNAGTSYLTTDHLGSTRVVTNSLGNVIARHDYLPFGEEITVPNIGGRTPGMGYAATDDTRQKFTSKERDTESGLDYFLARYFSGAQGRFTSEDPFSPILERQGDANANRAQARFDAYLQAPQQWNRYAYVTNNPLKYADPSGERIEIFGTEEERKAAFERIQAVVGPEGARLLYMKEENGHYYVETKDSYKLTDTGELGFRIAALIAAKDTVEFHIARTFQLKVSEWWGLVNKVVTKSVNVYGGAATLSASESTTGNTQIFVAPNAAEIAETKLNNLIGRTRMSNNSPPEFTNDIVDAHEFGHAWANAILKQPTSSDEGIRMALKFENAARARHGMKAFRIKE
jgi:RHS repeat-associated protein